MDFEDVFLAQNVLQNLNEAEVAYNRPRRQFLHSEDPFNLADNRFKKLFRLTKDSVREVIERVRPYIPAPTRESALSVETKVSCSVLLKKKHNRYYKRKILVYCFRCLQH